jgi:hypothetical protein
MYEITKLIHTHVMSKPAFVWQKPHSLVVKPMVLRRGCVMPAALASKFLNMSYTYDYNTSITN